MRPLWFAIFAWCACSTAAQRTFVSLSSNAGSPAIDMATRRLREEVAAEVVLMMIGKHAFFRDVQPDYGPRDEQKDKRQHVMAMAAADLLQRPHTMEAMDEKLTSALNEVVGAARNFTTSVDVFFETLARKVEHDAKLQPDFVRSKAIREMLFEILPSTRIRYSAPEAPTVKTLVLQMFSQHVELRKVTICALFLETRLEPDGEHWKWASNVLRAASVQNTRADVERVFEQTVTEVAQQFLYLHDTRKLLQTLFEKLANAMKNDPKLNSELIKAGLLS